MAVTGIAESRGVMPPHIEVLTDERFSEDLLITLHVSSAGTAAIADVELPSRKLNGWNVVTVQARDGLAFVSGRIALSDTQDLAFYGEWLVSIDNLKCLSADAALIEAGQPAHRFYDAKAARRRFESLYGGSRRRHPSNRLR